MKLCIGITLVAISLIIALRITLLYTKPWTHVLSKHVSSHLPATKGKTSDHGVAEGIPAILSCSGRVMWWQDPVEGQKNIDLLQWPVLVWTCKLGDLRLPLVPNQDTAVTLKPWQPRAAFTSRGFLYDAWRCSFSFLSFRPWYQPNVYKQSTFSMVHCESCLAVSSNYGLQCKTLTAMSWQLVLVKSAP